MNADIVRPAGLNQSRLNDMPVSEEPDFASAITANSTRTTIWNPTRMNWTCSVVVMPRYDTAVAIARKIRQVTTLISLFSHSAPMESLPVRSPMNW